MDEPIEKTVVMKIEKRKSISLQSIIEPFDSKEPRNTKQNFIIYKACNDLTYFIDNNKYHTIFNQFTTRGSCKK